jgi:hypothetical protein
MSEYTFFGKLRPDHDFYSTGCKIQVRLPSMPLKMVFNDVAVSFNYDLLICNSDVVIKVTDIEENLTAEYTFITTLRNIIKQAVSPIVNIYNYIFSSGFDIEIFRVQLSDGVEIEISSFLGDRAENQRKRPFAELGEGKQFEKILILLNSLFTEQSNGGVALNPTSNSGIVAGNHFLEALVDFREAIMRSGHTPLHCYRALENIRQAIVAGIGVSIKDIEKEWEVLREKLIIDKCSLIVVTRLAEQNRHAGYCPISGRSYDTIIEFLTQVLDRYILYLDNGFKGLEESEVKFLTLQNPIPEIFELPKIKEDIRKYSEFYPDECKLIESIKKRNDIQEFIKCISILQNLKNQEAEKQKKEKSSSQQDLKKEVKDLNKKLKKAHNKRNGAIALLTKLKQESSGAIQAEKIERVIALLAGE